MVVNVRSLVSVIIPCYNKGPHIAQAIGSVLNQSYRPIEIIVVDDGSTDDSPVEIGRFAARLRIIRTSNHGASHARNLGAATASGQYLMFLDADDIIDPDVIAGLVEAIRDREDVIAACDWTFLLGGSVRGSPMSVRPLPRDPLAAWLEGWYVPTCAVLWPARGLELVGGWDETLRANQDGELVMRALLRGLRFVVSGRGRALYRKDSGSASITDRLDRVTFESRLTVLEGVDSTLRQTGRHETYRLPLARAYYGLVRAHFGTLPASSLRKATRLATALAGAEALPRSLAHRLAYRLLGANGVVWGGKAFAIARSLGSTSARRRHGWR